MKKWFAFLPLLLLIPFAVAVECGDIVRSNDDDSAGITVLDDNLYCDGRGLVITGKGVFLDCQGHSITSDAGTTAIDIKADEVMVRNCVISGFKQAFVVDTVDNVILRDNQLLNNRVGFVLKRSNDVVIRDNTIKQGTFGVLHEFSDDVQLVNNEFVNITVEVQDSLVDVFVEEIEIVEEVVVVEIEVEPVDNTEWYYSSDKEFTPIIGAAVAEIVAKPKKSFWNILIWVVVAGLIAVSIFYKHKQRSKPKNFGF